MQTPASIKPHLLLWKEDGEELLQTSPRAFHPLSHQSWKYELQTTPLNERKHLTGVDEDDGLLPSNPSDRGAVPENLPELTAMDHQSTCNADLQGAMQQYEHDGTKKDAVDGILQQYDSFSKHYLNLMSDLPHGRFHRQKNRGRSASLTIVLQILHKRLPIVLKPASGLETSL